MTRYRLKKCIILNFLLSNTSEDVIICPDDGLYVVVKDNIVYVDRQGELIESNHSTWVVKQYVIDGDLEEII